MNLEDLPDLVKQDIEDQSLSILEYICDDIIVIGGWAVRALLGEKHGRYTLDIDGVASAKNLSAFESRLSLQGLQVRPTDWGQQFYHSYNPTVTFPDDLRDIIKDIELRIEISTPRIKEYQTDHFFEFSLSAFEEKVLAYHTLDKHIVVRVPCAEDMAAVKLGLPVDYKNNFDAQMLLTISDIDKVIERIKVTDKWAEIVLRRLPKLIGRLQQPDRLEHILCINRGVTIKHHVRMLKYIESELLI